MSTNKRNGKKWTINEVLALQREYELLELSIQQIALKHKRSVGAILSKMQAEGIIDSWNKARGFDILEFNKIIHTDESDYEDDFNLTNVHNSNSDNCIKKLTERVYTLETNIKDIVYMVKKLTDNMSYSGQSISSYNV